MNFARPRQKLIKTTRRTSQPPLINFQNKIIEMDFACQGVEEDVETVRVRWFIRWTFDKQLGKKHFLSWESSDET